MTQHVCYTVSTEIEAHIQNINKGELNYERKYQKE